MKQKMDQNILEILNSLFKRSPNPCLHTEVNRLLEDLSICNIKTTGNPGGWAGGIIYVSANQNCRACGILHLHNKEVEEFFNVSMSTIYRQARII